MPKVNSTFDVNDSAVIAPTNATFNYSSTSAAVQQPVLTTNQTFEVSDTAADPHPLPQPNSTFDISCIGDGRQQIPTTNDTYDLPPTDTIAAPADQTFDTHPVSEYVPCDTTFDTVLPEMNPPTGPSQSSVENNMNGTFNCPSSMCAQQSTTTASELLNSTQTMLSTNAVKSNKPLSCSKPQASGLKPGKLQVCRKLTVWSVIVNRISDDYCQLGKLMILLLKIPEPNLV